MLASLLLIVGAAVFAGVFVLALHYARKLFNTIPDQQRAQETAAEYENLANGRRTLDDQGAGESTRSQQHLLEELRDVGRRIWAKRCGKMVYLVVLAGVYTAILHGTVEVERFRREAERNDRKLEQVLIEGTWKSVFDEPIENPNADPGRVGDESWLHLPIARAVAAFLVLLWLTHCFLLFTPFPPFGQPLAYEDDDPKRMARAARKLDRKLQKGLNELWTMTQRAPQEVRVRMLEMLRQGTMRRTEDLAPLLRRDQDDDHDEGQPPATPIPIPPDGSGPSDHGSEAEMELPPDQPVQSGARRPSGHDHLS